MTFVTSSEYFGVESLDQVDHLWKELLPGLSVDRNLVMLRLHDPLANGPSCLPF